MDQDTKRNVKLGLFVIIGIIVFIFGIFLVGAKGGMFTKSFKVYAIFKNTSGLKSGGNVRFDGVKVGIVKDVTIANDSSVRVDMNIDESKHEFITKTAVASIASDGLMGDELVNITSGTLGSPEAENGDRIASREPMSMEKMIARLSGTSDNVNVITENLKNLTNDLNSKNGSIQSLFKDTTMAVNLRQTFANLKATSEVFLAEGNDVRHLTDQISHGNGVLAKLINDPVLSNNLSAAVTKLKETSDKLGMVADQASVTMQHANSGSGPLNTVLTDAEMSNNIKETVANLKKASVTLNEDLVAAQHNFLLKGYFKDKKKSEKP